MQHTQNTHIYMPSWFPDVGIANIWKPESVITDDRGQLGDLEERCKLPQWRLGQSPSQLLFWCIWSFTEGLWRE